MTRRATAATLALVAGGTLLLPWERLDTAVSRLYYAPAVPHGPWQDPRWIPWGALAHVTTFVAIGLALVGIACLARGRARTGIALLLGLALGPGLLVNVILKDHWHRPRPRQTLGLGGDFAYVPPLRIGPAGKSFPCGHSAVGFACIALAGLVDARRRGTRVAVVAAVVLLGSVLGLGRVATGAHFASDVVWSALLTFAVFLPIDWAVDRLPARARSAGDLPAGRRTGRAVAVVAVGAAALASALLCFPFRQEAAPHDFPIPDSGATLDLRVGVGHARLIFGPPGAAVLTVESRHDGFGVPWGRIEETMAGGPDTSGSSPATAAVRYRLGWRGWFADLEGTTILRLPAGTVGHVDIEVVDGHLTLIDAGGGAPLPVIRCRIRQDALRLRGLRRDQLELIER